MRRARALAGHGLRVVGGLVGLALVSSGFGSTSASAEPGRWTNETVVTLWVHVPFSPFSWVQWEWKTRGGAPIWSASRQPGEGVHHETELSLVDETTHAAARAGLGVCRALAWRDGRAQRPAARGEAMEVLQWSDGSATWWVELESHDPSHQACRDAVREPLRSHVRFRPFRVPWWSGVETGLLRAESEPSAWLWIDGRPTFEVTPVTDLVVEVGTRQLRWVSVRGERVREESVRIEPGRTTSIRVRIEGDEEPRAPEPLDRPAEPVPGEMLGRGGGVPGE